MLNALSTAIAAGAVIDASATDNGKGGTIAVWSDGNTVFDGTIYARGGPNGGNGGWVETSGHVLKFGSSAAVDTRAPVGIAGVWLADLFDYLITTAACGPTDTCETPAQIVAALAANAIVQRNSENDVFVQAAIDATTVPGATGTLVLVAGRTVNIAAYITLNGVILPASRMPAAIRFCQTAPSGPVILSWPLVSRSTPARAAPRQKS